MTSEDFDLTSHLSKSFELMPAYDTNLQPKYNPSSAVINIPCHLIMPVLGMQSALQTACNLLG